MCIYHVCNDFVYPLLSESRVLRLERLCSHLISVPCYCLTQDTVSVLGSRGAAESHHTVFVHPCGFCGYISGATAGDENMKQPSLSF